MIYSADKQAVLDRVAKDIEDFAERCYVRAKSVADQMTECANLQNLGTVETYRQAANIARAGIGYTNTNCSKCHDTRGGPREHETDRCTWNPPEGLFDEHEPCYGRDLVQVGWLGWPDRFYTMHTAAVPGEGRKPIFMRKSDGEGESNQVDETDAELIERAITTALDYGSIGGAHEKQWTLDQIVRILAGDRYEQVIADWCAGEDGPDTYGWNIGTAP